jgi:hypothetical protein
MGRASPPPIQSKPLKGNLRNVQRLEDIGNRRNRILRLAQQRKLYSLSPEKFEQDQPVVNKSSQCFTVWLFRSFYPVRVIILNEPFL